MGDRVAVMKDGVLQQVDTPLNLYDKPVNLFVAGFIGSPAMNLLRAKAVDGHARSASIAVPVARDAASKASREHHARSPPRELADRQRGRGHPGQGDGRRGARRGRLRLRHERRGGHAGQRDHPHRRPPRPPQGRDDPRHDGPEHVHVFDTDSGKRLTS